MHIRLRDWIRRGGRDADRFRRFALVRILARGALFLLLELDALAAEDELLAGAEGVAMSRIGRQRRNDDGQQSRHDQPQADLPHSRTSPKCSTRRNTAALLTLEDLFSAKKTIF